MAKASSDFTPILIFGGLAAGAYFLYQNGSLSTLFSSVSSLLPASAGGIAPAVVSTVAASGSLLSTRLKPAPADWRPRASTLPCSGLGQTTSAYAGIASAIQQQEGYFPGSLSYTLNNPGNLQYAGQAGATPVTANGATWASFSTYAAGFQALENQVALDASRGLTISQFTAKYAPASDGNDPSTYANNISAAVGLSPSDPLSAAAGDGSVSATGSDSSLTDLLGISDNGSFDLVSPWVLAGVAAAVLVVAVV